MSEIHRVSTVADLDGQLAASNEQDVWFFKHSLTCGVSDAAWSEFERFAAERKQDPARFCLIEIQTARRVSQALAERLDVCHESPQVIRVRAGQAVWHASHWEITRSNLIAEA
jgi:bacillithiol system protein YtxJ